MQLVLSGRKNIAVQARMHPPRLTDSGGGHIGQVRRHVRPAELDDSTNAVQWQTFQQFAVARAVQHQPKPKSPNGAVDGSCMRERHVRCMSRPPCHEPRQQKLGIRSEAGVADHPGSRIRIVRQVRHAFRKGNVVGGKEPGLLVRPGRKCDRRFTPRKLARDQSSVAELRPGAADDRFDGLSQHTEPKVRIAGRKFAEFCDWLYQQRVSIPGKGAASC